MSKILYTPLQLALKASINFNDEANIEEYNECANRVRQFIGIGDPYTTLLILDFLGEVFKPEGALADEKNLEKFVEKLIYWIEVANGTTKFKVQ